MTITLIILCIAVYGLIYTHSTEQTKETLNKIDNQLKDKGFKDE
jgi:hypothetical protein